MNRTNTQAPTRLTGVLLRGLRNQLNVWRLLLKRLLIGPNKGVLVYLGGHQGYSLKCIVHRYKRCYIFEPVLINYVYLRLVFFFHFHVQIIRAAAAQEDGWHEFYRTSNKDASSSLHAPTDWLAKKALFVKEKVRVRTVNIPKYLQAQGVEQIDDYISDIQGMDATVLATMTPYLDECRIQSVQSEVAYTDLYEGPSNTLAHFDALLKANYTLVGEGDSVVKHLKSPEVPLRIESQREVAQETDFKWVLQKTS